MRLDGGRTWLTWRHWGNCRPEGTKGGIDRTERVRCRLDQALRVLRQMTQQIHQPHLLYRLGPHLQQLRAPHHDRQRLRALAWSVLTHLGMESVVRFGSARWPHRQLTISPPKLANDSARTTAHPTVVRLYTRL